MRLSNCLLAVFAFDDECPDYDMDSEDETWLESYNGSRRSGGYFLLVVPRTDHWHCRTPLTVEEFEKIVDKIEKSNRVQPVACGLSGFG